MIESAQNEHRNWRQEPLVWLLIGIPLSAVIMGIIILTLAIQSWSGLVVDDYYRKGKQINRVLARDQLAYELGLAADLRVLESGRIEIRFDPGVSVIPGEHLELKLVHATRPGLDRTPVLRQPATAAARSRSANSRPRSLEPVPANRRLAPHRFAAIPAGEQRRPASQLHR